MTDNTAFHKSDVPMLIAGTFFYVLTFCVIVPAGAPILPGSTIGVALVLHILFGLPIGACNLAMNIPIMFFCTKIFGKKILIYTIIIVFGTSALIDLIVPRCEAFFPGEDLLNTLISSLLMGIGAGLYLRAGGTMAGTTALCRIICRSFPRLSFGTILIVFNVSIIAIGAVAQDKLSILLYSILFTVICSKLQELVMLWRR